MTEAEVAAARARTRPEHPDQHRVVNPWMTEADEAALAQFEAIVLSQKPADKAWAPVTDYSWEAREPIERPHAAAILEAFGPLRGRGPRQAAGVLDVGSGPGHLTRCLRDLGYDVTEADVVPRHRDVMRLDLAQRRWMSEAIRWPLVICRECLEHLRLVDIREAVRNLCQLSAQFVYVTTRFAENPTTFLAVAQSDDLDPTHCTMLNQAFLRALIVLEGFRRRPDLEQKLDWQQKGRCLVYERA